MKFKKNGQSGFTLIELLIVVMVIGSLTGVLISVIDVRGLQGKARDAERVSDLKQIQTALELYFSENRSYPLTVWVEVTGSGFLSSNLTPDFISKIPSDPLAGSTPYADPCDDPNTHRYNYLSHDGTYYRLTAIMEKDSSNDDNPCDSSTCPLGLNTVDYCYEVDNP